MAKLVKAVFVRDPERNRTVILQPGEEPEPRLAALVTNPDAWEGGKLPDTAVSAASGDEATGDGSTDKPAPPAKPAARKPAAKKPARGRDAADEGSSGD